MALGHDAQMRAMSRSAHVRCIAVHNNDPALADQTAYGEQGTGQQGHGGSQEEKSEAAKMRHVIKTRSTWRKRHAAKVKQQADTLSPAEPPDMHEFDSATRSRNGPGIKSAVPSAAIEMRPNGRPIKGTALASEKNGEEGQPPTSRRERGVGRGLLAHLPPCSPLPAS